MSRGSVTVKRLILVFWASWFAIVFLTNLFDGLKALGVVGERWAFASGNWAFMIATTKIYRVPVPLVGALFVGVVAWEGLSALLMWSAAGTLGKAPDLRSVKAIYRAFTVAIALFAAFAVVDEIFIAYPVEGTHLRILVTLLASLLALRLLPDEPSLRSPHERAAPRRRPDEEKQVGATALPWPDSPRGPSASRRRSGGFPWFRRRPP